MSLVKYRLREVAADFGVTPKEIGEILTKFFEKPKSNTQVLTEEELNVVFDVITARNQISSIEQVFAVKPKAPAKEAPKAEAPKAEAPKAETPKGPNGPQNGQQGKPGAAPQKPKAPEAPAKPKEPERKRERRVIDTSAVTVNANRFDDRVDVLMSERQQNFSGGKQKIGGKNKQQSRNKFAGNKRRNEEQEKMRRLQLEVAKKAPLVVKIPDEITVGELASRMKKTAAEVIKYLLVNLGIMANLNQTIDFETAELVATELGCKVEKNYFSFVHAMLACYGNCIGFLRTRARIWC